ncbi:unnamed protein product [Diatraea saccharalis]|uniref:TATA element modulatory factor 1 TATA binding domain-containing protein n=1 Tax=Diatraea saccharalis TaxID=40085 RepID=A0A9P0CA62_9NEOP|nr:unnamed protein product [Diatraea saccharalis]
MNWFDTSGLTSLAKTALKEAQKTIDKALDIQDDSSEEREDESPTQSKAKISPSPSNTPHNDNTDFFSSWGLSVSAESSKDKTTNERHVVTESPSKSSSQSMWGSFAGSFFEQPLSSDIDSAIVRPPKAKSMNVISDVKYGSQDELFSKSQLVMSDNTEEFKVIKTKEEIPKFEERRGSSRSNRLSLVSSRNSSDSVEVLSQSLKTTPDSEAASGQSMSHSSSIGQKINSESVEILPDSLVSPSSIECLGFDSFSSDKNSSTPSSNLSPCDLSDKKSTPVGDRTERVDTADSVSLVADDDEDTMSYNSISECTAPTVLDTDDKSASPFPKTFRGESRKVIDKDFIHLEQPVLTPRMQISENSSNDGSWSDRTLNADNDSVNLEPASGEPKKEMEPEDILIERLSDSSSFYNVNVTGEMMQSESSAFVNVESQQCAAPDSSESSRKDSSVKERTSPISSDSKSDLVKIGSDRTSGHTSGDELETTTSSDIEIIPSPNGDNGHGFSRNSPAKYAFKQSKFDGTTSPNLVDLVLGKSLATKIRGHNRELSEASIQSNTSDESQGSENERLMRRLCEMTEILEARENKLIEVSRNNAELAENNAELKIQLESMQAKHEGGDISVITEDYTQRMSALEKKFQQAIREKDQLRKQLDSLKSESSRKNSNEFENALKEKDEVITQLQEEGEKLARQQLQHSNIIKRLRAKEKDNEQVIKSLRDKIAEQASELERLKRSMAAKEELEVSQIEAVYKLTTANKRLEQELAESKSSLDDTTQRLESSRMSLEAARHELMELQRGSEELIRRRASQQQLENDVRVAREQAAHADTQLQHLRATAAAEERRWAAREEALRREIQETRDMYLSGVSGTIASTAEESPAPAAALLAQLAQLQRACLQRDQRHQRHAAQLQQRLAEAEASAAKAIERERMCKEECSALQLRVSETESALQHTRGLLDRAAEDCHGHLEQLAVLQQDLKIKNEELESLRMERDSMQQKCGLHMEQLEQLERRLQEVSDALVAERNRNAILQERASSRGDVSPHSVGSDSFSNSTWVQDEMVAGAGVGSALGMSVGVSVGSALGVEQTLAALRRREGEVRALTGDLQHARRQLLHLRATLADLTAAADHHQSLQEQYDALLQMYGEKEEQLSEAKLDLHDVTQLYKAQLDELVQLKRQVAALQR